MCVKRDNELIEIEKRNFFSLLCLDLEAQLIHVNLAQLPEIFHNLVSTQVKGHTQVRRHSGIFLHVLFVCKSLYFSVPSCMGRHEGCG